MNNLTQQSQNDYFIGYETSDGTLLIVPHQLDVEQQIEPTALQSAIVGHYTTIESLYIVLLVVTLGAAVYRGYCNRER